MVLGRLLGENPKRVWVFGTFRKVANKCRAKGYNKTVSIALATIVTKATPAASRFTYSCARRLPSGIVQDAPPCSMS